MTNETQQTGGWKAWSEKTWVVVVSGVFMPPVGIILAWLKPDWSSKTKWIATCVMGLLLIGMISADNDENSRDAAPDAASAASSNDTAATGESDEDEGYRYASNILRQAAAASPSQKRAIMQPLVDLGEQGQKGTSGKSRGFHRGVARAMDEFMDRMIRMSQ